MSIAASLAKARRSMLHGIAFTSDERQSGPAPMLRMVSWLRMTGRVTLALPRAAEEELTDGGRRKGRPP